MQQKIKSKTIDSLADELIKEISNNQNPFDSYVVAFPNSIVEQWFKAYWLKKMDTVLMNVEFTKLPSLLFTALAHDNKEIITIDAYKNLILHYFMKEGVSELSKEMQDYVLDKNKNINSIHLYDFAKTMASLFMNYENKDIWNSIPEASWQKKLYNSIAIGSNNYTSLYEMMKKPVAQVSNKKYFLFGFSYIEPLHKKAIDIISKNNTVTIYYQTTGKDSDLLELDEAIEFNCSNPSSDVLLGSAPSKLREVEFVHGQICELLKTEDVRYSDILVVCPNLSEYKGHIAKVFKQVEKDKFYDIPYVIADRTNTSGHVGEALAILFDMIQKKDFTRKDFYNLISNRTIAKIRGYSYDFVDVITKSILELSVYRNNQDRNPNGDDEWELAKNNMLLAQIVGSGLSVENMRKLSTNSYIPYSTIGLDRSYINLFCVAIDDLKRLLNYFKDKKEAKKEDLEFLKVELDKWLSLKDGLEDENDFFYKDVANTLNKWIELVKNYKIPMEIIYASLIDAACISMSGTSGILTQGITFIPFDRNCILSCDYVFFMGMNSANLPRKKIKCDFDLSKDPFTTQKEDMYIFTALRNNAKKYYLSYDNMDLKSGEEFFPSILIKNIPYREEKLTIDEKRSYGKLYTRSEFEKKNYIDKLEGNSTAVSFVNPKLKLLEVDSVKKVSIREIENYIKEPIAAKANQVFGTWEDYKMDDILKEYEPFTTQQDYNIETEMIRIMLKDNCLYPIESQEINDIKLKYKTLHKLPYLFSDELFEQMYNRVAGKYEKIMNAKNGKTGLLHSLKDIRLSYMDNQKQVVWYLTNKYEMYMIYSGNSYSFYTVSGNSLVKKSNINSFIRLYVYSLATVVSLNDPKTIYTIDLGGIKEYEITYQEAVDILNRIHKEMFNYEDKRVIPILNVDKVSSGESLDYEKYVEDVYKKAWSDFKDSMLFNPFKQNGFNRTTFASDWKNACDEKVAIVKIVNKKEQEEDNE